MNPEQGGEGKNGPRAIDPGVTALPAGWTSSVRAGSAKKTRYMTELGHPHSTGTLHYAGARQVSRQLLLFYRLEKHPVALGT